MTTPIQFSLRRMLAATAVLAVWCGMAVGSGKFEHWVEDHWADEISLDELLAGEKTADGVVDSSSYTVESNGTAAVLRGVYFAVVVGLPALAVGLLAGKPLLGALCGAASGMGVLALHAAMYFELWGW